MNAIDTTTNINNLVLTVSSID